MELGDCDIVYVVKPCFSNEELRYSLRSVAKNFPHRKVWIVGGQPTWLRNVKTLNLLQNGNSKWENVNKGLLAVCNCPYVTEKFVLFNDDFFVMNPVKKLENFYDGSLEDRAKVIENDHTRPTPSPYTIQLMESKYRLEMAGLDSKNYELHVPMMFEKNKLLAVLPYNMDSACRRSIYGNRFCVGKASKDYKGYLKTSKWNGKSNYFSTTDEAFERGICGEQIRNRFEEPCIYEA